MVLDKEAIIVKGGESEHARKNAPSACDFEHVRQDASFFMSKWLEILLDQWWNGVSVAEVVVYR